MHAGNALRVKSKRIDLQRVFDTRIRCRRREPVVRWIVVEEAKIVVIFAALYRTHRAEFSEIQKNESIAVISDDEEPVFPAVPPFILQRDRLADATEVGLV